MKHLVDILTFWLFLLGFVLGETKFWSRFASEEDSAIRTQRDLAYDIPIDQLGNFGISLKNSIFDRVGYSNESLEYIRSLLNVGVQTLMIDIYWNEQSGIWQLCPAPIPLNASNIGHTYKLSWKNKTYNCQPDFCIRSMTNTLRSYFESSNSNLDLDLIQIYFNLHTIPFDYDDHRRNITYQEEKYEAYKLPKSVTEFLGNSTIGESVSPLESYIFTPNDLKTYQSSHVSSGFFNHSSLAFPTLRYVLLTTYKRLLVGVYNNNMPKKNQIQPYNFTTSDNSTIFYRNELKFDSASTSNDEALQKCNNVMLDFSSHQKSINAFNHIYRDTHFRRVTDSDEHPFTEKSIREYVNCGYAPILNSSFYPNLHNNSTYLESLIDTYLPLSFYSWAEGEPHDQPHTKNKTSGKEIAYKCVAWTADGWKLSNCYSTHLLACRKKGEPNNWLIDKSKKQYFDAYFDCPKGYTLGVPRSSVEEMSLRNVIDRDNITSRVWIDLNDITVPGCFVSGGPYSQCPYQKTVTKLKLVRMIAPSFVVAVVLLILMFFERFVRTAPIQSNRKKYWKKAINDYYKANNYEGVPS